MSDRARSLLMLALGCAFLAGCNDTADDESDDIFDAGPPVDGGTLVCPDAGPVVLPDGGPVSVLPATSDYTISVWAEGTVPFFGPDSIDFDGTHIWVGYQNKTNKQGMPQPGDSPGSTIVEYSIDGKTVIGTWDKIPGHMDGLRYDKVRNLIWASCNEDGNATLQSIDPSTQVLTTYTISPTPLPHGGGIDDLAFVNGKMFASASAPANFDPVTGLNMNAGIYQIDISGTTATFTEALHGSFPNTDILTNGSLPNVNMTDPDSIGFDNKGNMVLVDQGDSQLIFISNPGLANQSASVYLVGTQLEETVWIPDVPGQKPVGELLIVDGKQNRIYAMHAVNGWKGNTIFTETPDDSGASSFVGTLDSSYPIISGALSTLAEVHPVAIGFTKATGLIWIPNQ